MLAGIALSAGRPPEMPRARNFIRRVWRGAWAGVTFAPPGGWTWLDIAVWPRNAFGALFTFLGPLLIAAGVWCASDARHGLVLAAIFVPLWLLTVAIAYWTGGAPAPKPARARASR